MSARSGMSTLITRLRAMSAAGTADYTDESLQTVLDKARLRVQREPLTAEPTYDAGGTVHYYDYYSLYGDYEETDGGTAVFVLEDSTGLEKGTADWTANYANGHIQFSVDQAGTSIYLTGRSYDLNAAAAQVWRLQAGQAAGKYTFAADGASYHRSDWFKHCKEMAAYYDALSRPVMVEMVRSDVN
jgi:hypothetical protein